MSELRVLYDRSRGPTHPTVDLMIKRGLVAKRPNPDMRPARSQSGRADLWLYRAPTIPRLSSPPVRSRQAYGTLHERRAKINPSSSNRLEAHTPPRERNITQTSRSPRTRHIFISARDRLRRELNCRRQAHAAAGARRRQALPIQSTPNIQEDHHHGEMNVAAVRPSASGASLLSLRRPLSLLKQTLSLLPR